MSQPRSEIPEISYEDARANVVAWKKGRKRKPNLIFINSAYNLVYRYHNGSFEDAAKDVKDISPRMLMKLASDARLAASSQKIRQLLDEGKISVDIAPELFGIKDAEQRDKTAEVVVGMNALDQRQVIRYAKRHPHASLEQFKERVLTSKDVKERIYMALLPLTEEEYERLKVESKKQKMSWDALCMKIIKDWLNERRK